MMMQKHHNISVDDSDDSESSGLVIEQENNAV
jgi:hypothetical protein